MRKCIRVLLIAVLVAWIVPGLSHPSYAGHLNVDTVLFNPTTDGGRYYSIHDAQTIPQWRFHAGAYFDFAHQPLEVKNVTTGATTSIVKELLMGHFQGGLGFTDWFDAGISVPVVFYENFLDPNTLVASPRETHSGMGDILIETKFRLLDNFRFPIGIALIPFMTFPTGNSDYYLGNGKTTAGAKVAIEANIHHHIWISMNWGYQYLPGQFQYYTQNADAYIDDLLIFGGGIHGKINDMWSLLAEIYGETVANNAFKSYRQTPIIARGGAKFSPKFKGNLRGLSFTIGAGGGLTKGVGDPNIQVLAGINYRKPRIVELEEPGASEVEARLEDKILITQKIHFEFALAVIRPVSYPILNDVADLLKQNPQIAKVRVEGHTDYVGSDAYNQRLSEKRADAVVEYLVQHGISQDRLTAAGYGRSRPIADNNTEEGRAENRRTEFTVLSNIE